jgi:hypothetical protein
MPVDPPEAFGVFCYTVAICHRSEILFPAHQFLGRRSTLPRSKVENDPIDAGVDRFIEVSEPDPRATASRRA